ncbi:MAG: DUF4867 family protein [Tractidigestivibacter sp.]|jgi:hypothetical protein|uniref:DUF4867 family protein n=1 Tax=Tractidigestivibacter sp. TaxID=2847320 RepID=UPI003D94B85A
MQIHEVTEALFSSYGRVVRCPKRLVAPIVEALATKTPLPEATDYVAEEPAVQELAEAKELAPALFGGLPVEFGWCNGHNTRLNCLEYHRSSEFNLGTEDFVLLLARQDQIADGVLDTSDVVAFRVPAGVLVEVYATTLHYAPCHVDPSRGFKVLVALPKGTNGPKPSKVVDALDAELLWANNKWLLAHSESAEAAQGAKVALAGENVDIADCLA